MTFRRQTDWQAPGDFVSGTRPAATHDGAFLDGLVIGAATTAIFFAGGFALILYYL